MELMGVELLSPNVDTEKTTNCRTIKWRVQGCLGGILCGYKKKCVLLVCTVYPVSRAKIPCKLSEVRLLSPSK